MIIPASGAKHFLRHMDRLGLIREHLFKNTLLDFEWFIDDDATISMKDYLQLVTNALDITGDKALGLKIGKWFNFTEYGMWGYSVLSCSTVKEAVDIMIKYYELAGGLVDETLQKDGDRLIIHQVPNFKSNDERMLVFGIEENISTHFTGFKTITGKHLDGAELHLTYPKPEHAGLYFELTQKKVFFGAANNLLILPSSLLDLPTITGSPTVKAVCEKTCREILQKSEPQDELIEKIKYIMVESRGDFPRSEEMASKLNISTRTLFRNLKKRGTTYMALLDEVRSSIASEYLKKTNLSIDQVSDLLGFSETTTFRQTFKKWKNVSPSEFRKKTVPQEIM